MAPPILQPGLGKLGVGLPPNLGGGLPGFDTSNLGGLIGTGGPSGAFNPLNGQQESLGVQTPTQGAQPPGSLPSVTTGNPGQVPGVSGITPGAVERRLGLTPPTMQASGAPTPPSVVMSSPGGPGNIDQSSLQDPLQAIQALIRQRSRG